MKVTPSGVLMPRPRFYARPSRSELRRLYKRNTDEAIAQIYGCTKEAVKGWRRSYGIKGIRRSGDGIGGVRRFDRPSKDELRSLTDVKTEQEIASIYGCSRAAVRKWREAYGLVKRTVVYRRRPWAYDLDEDFFEKIDTQSKAYILGMLATDGCVADGKSHSNRVFLSLQARDEHILHEILKEMHSDSPVHDRGKGSFPGSGPMKYIALTSRRLVADLAKWGISPRKTLVLRYTNVSPWLERHYLRGLLDGDGSVSPKSFYFLGTEALIDGVVDAVQRHTGIHLNKRKAGRLHRASGYAGSSLVLRWLYHGSTIFLRRKKAIYEESWM
jgi:hypothetical protein